MRNSTAIRNPCQFRAAAGRNLVYRWRLPQHAWLVRSHGLAAVVYVYSGGLWLAPDYYLVPEGWRKEEGWRLRGGPAEFAEARGLLGARRKIQPVYREYTNAPCFSEGLIEYLPAFFRGDHARNPAGSSVPWFALFMRAAMPTWQSPQAMLTAGKPRPVVIRPGHLPRYWLRHSHFVLQCQTSQPRGKHHKEIQGKMCRQAVQVEGRVKVGGRAPGKRDQFWWGNTPSM